ncbi:MAG: hypothetical protein KDB43_16985 [Nocardioidaceae bacterium]|nr:hypothetical protein [Nocardioidaceae bacterium]
MACPQHNLSMLRLVLRGEVRGPKHARLLTEIRQCRWCRKPAAAARPRYAPAPPRVPRPRLDEPALVHLPGR